MSTLQLNRHYCLDHKRKIERDMVGKKFNNLTVLGFEINENDKNRWKFQCDCGNICYADISNVCKGKKRFCGDKNCYLYRYSKENLELFNNELILMLSNNQTNNMLNKELDICISNTRWSKISKDAISRKIDFNISKEYIEKLYYSQNGLCNLTKIPINEQTMSLDRIDSSKGYIENNVQWIHTYINMMKSDFDQLYFIGLCKRVLEFQKTKYTAWTYIPYTPNKRGRPNKGELPRSFWNKIIKKAQRRNINFDPNLTPLYAEQLFIQQSATCALSGMHITLRPKNKRTASLDRKESKLGYAKDNIQWVHNHINMIKWILNKEIFINVCTAISRNFPNINIDPINYNNKRKPYNLYKHPFQQTTEQFIKKIQKIHGDKLDYSKVVYKDRLTMINIGCKACLNSFMIQPYLLFERKNVCKNCKQIKAQINTVNRKQIKKEKRDLDRQLRPIKRKEKFIKKAILKHGSKYDYSQVVYVNCHIPIKIYCNKCGNTFEQLIQNHLQKNNCCPICK